MSYPYLFLLIKQQPTFILIYFDIFLQNFETLKPITHINILKSKIVTLLFYYLFIKFIANHLELHFGTINHFLDYLNIIFKQDLSSTNSITLK